MGRESDIDGSAGSIAIFCSRETPERFRTTLADALAAAPSGSLIEVLVNGNPELSQVAAKHVASLDFSGGGPIVRVWNIPLGDKANAWNEYIHRIWPGAGNAYFIDGYVSLHPGAIRSMMDSLRDNQDALGGTGLPSTGRSSKKLRGLMLQIGGFHGNFCCLTGATLEQFKTRGIRLPLGLYRTDAAIGSILSFGLDPSRHRWDSRRYIAIALDTTSATAPKRWWKASDLKATFKRLLRQAQGRLETYAVRDHLSVRKQDPAHLSHTVHDLVLGWVERKPQEAAAKLKWDPLMKLALGKLQARKDWASVDISPELVSVSGNARAGIRS
jgi:hypothetical protein